MPYKGKRILLVDDENSVLMMTELMLQKFGFEVFPAVSANDALEVFSSKKLEHWDAVLTDVTMPGKNGICLCRQINEMAPSLPVFIMSAALPENCEIPKECAGFMKKPFYPKDLEELLSCLAC